MEFLRCSALMVIGVHWPPPLNGAAQRAQVPLGHRLTADPYVPAPLYTKAEVEGPAQLGVRQRGYLGL